MGGFKLEQFKFALYVAGEHGCVAFTSRLPLGLMLLSPLDLSLSLSSVTLSPSHPLSPNCSGVHFQHPSILSCCNRKRKSCTACCQHSVCLPSDTTLAPFVCVPSASTSRITHMTKTQTLTTQMSRYQSSLLSKKLPPTLLLGALKHVKLQRQQLKQQQHQHQETTVPLAQ